MIRQLLSLLVFFLVAGYLAAQQPSYVHYSVDAGLPSSTVYQVVQVANGDLWFATENGVARFDGYSFKAFTTADGLASNEVLSIFEDSSERIWFLTYSGQPCFYHRNEFHNPQNDTLLAQVPQGLHLFVCYEALDQTIWLGNKDNAVCKIDFELGKVTKVPLDIGLHDSPIIGIWRDNTGQEVLVGQARYTWTKSGNTVLSEYPGFSNSKLYSFPDQDQLYRSTMHGLVRFSSSEGETMVLDSVALGGNEVTFLGGMGTNTLAIGSSSGLYLLRETAAGLDLDHWFENVFVTSAILDQEGRYWLTTMNDGVYYIPSLAVSTVLPVGHQPGTPIFALECDPHGNLWVGSDNDYVITIKDSIQTKINLSLVAAGRKRVRDFVILEEATMVLRDNSSEWITDEGTKAIPIFPKAFRKRSDGLLMSYHRGTMWLPSQTDIEDMAFNLQFYADHLLVSERAYAICNAEGTISYMGFNSGLKIFDGERIVENEVTQSIQHPVRSLLFDSKNRLWVGTNGGGVALLHNGNWQHFNTDNVLLSNVCLDFAEATDGIWVATRAGVTRLTEDSSGQFHSSHIQYSDGLRSNEVTAIEVVDSTLWVATTNGLNRIDLSRWEPIRNAPRMRFEWAMIGEQCIFDTAVVLERGHKPVRIFYSGVALSEHGNLRYRYRLLGQDTAWQTTLDRSVQYSDLLPGSYTFQVSAIAGSGLSSAEYATFSITVPVPFWRNPWLLGSGALVLVLLGAVAFKFDVLRFDRQALQTVLEALIKKDEPTPVPLFFRVDGRKIKVLPTELCYVKAAGDYAEMFTTEKKILVHSTLKSIYDSLPEQDFVRVHRSYIVRLDQIEGIVGTKAIIVAGTEIPVGKTYRTALATVRQRIEIVP